VDADSDPDTLDLRTPGGNINAAEYSMPHYIGTASDPLTLVRCTDTIFPLPDQHIRIPANATPALPVNGDRHMILFDRTQPQWMWSYYSCIRNGDGSITAKLGQKDDVNSNQLGANGLSGGYNFGIGTMRSWEVQAGTIKHMLRCSLNPARLKSPANDWLTGIPWPNREEDYYGPRDYTGNVVFGSTIGISRSIRLEALGLTAGGLMLARVLQTYGATIRDSCGSPSIDFYAEPSTENTTAIAQMRADLPKIVRVLSIMRNQSAGSVNGGGIYP
jgi:hypothetical protein